MTEEKYGFIIDTNQYAGNFEREMCAYVTGTIGDCEVGDTERDEFLEDVKDGLIPQSIVDEIEEKIMQVADEHACYRPVEIHYDKNSAYNSLIIYFSERPSKELVEFMKARAPTFTHKYVKDLQVLGFRVGIEKTIFEETFEEA